MILLGIETSCDETGIAVLESEDTASFRIPADVIASQIQLHRPYGGVYPTLAKRCHQENLPKVLAEALERTGLSSPRLSLGYPRLSLGGRSLGGRGSNAVAVAHGPGLSPCLWAGITFAQQLAKEWSVPIIPVNHMEGHFLVSLLWQKGAEFRIPGKDAFPVLGLLVSGGHTELVLSPKLGEYLILGETVDDAAGEAFDKTARILDLPYPGGPEIARLAASTDSPRPSLGIRLPRPMLHQKNYNFSFSGLKTAVLYDVRKRTEKERTSPEYRAAMAFEIQQAILDVLITKTMKAVQEFQPRTAVLGGGVAANEELRKQLEYKLQDTRCKIQFRVPPKELCTDNGSMIAAAGFVRRLLGEKLAPGAPLEAQPALRLQ